MKLQYVTKNCTITRKLLFLSLHGLLFNILCCDESNYWNWYFHRNIKKQHPSNLILAGSVNFNHNEMRNLEKRSWIKPFPSYISFCVASYGAFAGSWEQLWSDDIYLRVAVNTGRKQFFNKKFSPIFSQFFSANVKNNLHCSFFYICSAIFRLLNQQL